MIMWDAEHGWHETEDTSKIMLDERGRIKWVRVAAATGEDA